ncbi:MAG: methylated-DNA--[protein]-cysteine S-methyltransferase [Ignavibacteria bacterium]|nr:methylated-DNA--[protein]-cysteine S-methyltransferase [Ignavibacteria bacterium]
MKSAIKDILMIETEISLLTIGANSRGICLIKFSGHSKNRSYIKKLSEMFEGPLRSIKSKYIRECVYELNQYFSGKLKNFTVPLDYQGTKFQMKVWDELKKIPYGHTISYSELALRIGASSSQRAVANANAMNRIAVIIPCHRVINKNGDIGGYSGGTEIKKFLLELEKKFR